MYKYVRLRVMSISCNDIDHDTLQEVLNRHWLQVMGVTDCIFQLEGSVFRMTYLAGCQPPPVIFYDFPIYGMSPLSSPYLL